MNEDRLSFLQVKVEELENQVKNLKQEGVGDQADQVRKVMADIPEVFTVHRRDQAGGMEKIELSLHYPSFYKLELIATEVQALLSSVQDDEDLMGETAIPRFILRLLGKEDLRDQVYKVLQIALDPLADPNPTDLTVPIETIKLLNPAAVIDALVKGSTPFFVQIFQILSLNKTA
jgi:hypothetical protein